MEGLARSGDEQILSFRIDCFSKAVLSAEAACRHPDIRRNMRSADAAGLLKLMEDGREMAVFQSKVVEQLNKTVEEEKELLHRNRDVFEDFEDALNELEELLKDGNEKLWPDYNTMYSKVDF
jgi:uncharacterized coiled-coil protein SlyX